MGNTSFTRCLCLNVRECTPHALVDSRREGRRSNVVLIVRKGTRITNLFQTAAQSTGFRGRKTSRRAYRKHLWNSTLFSTKYRSLGNFGSTVSTTSKYNISTVSLFNLLRFGTNAFWTTGGGLQPHDFGVTSAVLEVILLLEVVYGMLNSRTWRLLILMSRLKYSC